MAKIFFRQLKMFLPNHSQRLQKIKTDLDSLGRFAGIFEVDSKVRAFSLAALGGIFRLNGIASHYPNSSEKRIERLEVDL